eukprot:s623_g5.t3
MLRDRTVGEMVHVLPCQLFQRGIQGDGAIGSCGHVADESAPGQRGIHWSTTSHTAFVGSALRAEVFYTLHPELQGRPFFRETSVHEVAARSAGALNVERPPSEAAPLLAACLRGAGTAYRRQDAVTAILHRSQRVVDREVLTESAPTFVRYGSGKGEKVCGACLLPIEPDSQLGAIDNCTHLFHHSCVEKWSQTENSCPQCKTRFFWLAAYDESGKRTCLTRIESRDQEEQEDEAFQEISVCEMCHEVGDETQLLLCDGMHGTCNATFHVACVGLQEVPRGAWFCPDCIERGFDVDAQGRRGCSQKKDRVVEVTPARPEARTDAQSSAHEGGPPPPAELPRCLPNRGNRFPSQLQLSALACVTPAVEVPTFNGNAPSPDLDTKSGAEPRRQPEGLFATFAARRRARCGSDTQQRTGFISLNPSYEDDFMANQKSGLEAAASAVEKYGPMAFEMEHQNYRQPCPDGKRPAMPRAELLLRNALLLRPTASDLLYLLGSALQAQGHLMESLIQSSPMESSFQDRLDRLLAQLRVDIQKLHESEVFNFSGGSGPSTPSNSSPRAGLRDAGFVHHVNSDEGPFERTLSSSNSGPASILKKRQKARPKMALFEKRPLKRTLTNLSLIDSTSSAGGGAPSAFLRRDKPPGQVAKVHSDEDDLTVADAIEDFDSESSGANVIVAIPKNPKGKTYLENSGEESKKSVQIIARADSSDSAPPGMPPVMQRSRARRASLASNMSKLSASSFFAQENRAVGKLGQFLRNPESSHAAWIFASLWNYFIAVTVMLSLGQTSRNPILSGLAIGIADGVVEFIFLLECIAEIAVEPCELSQRLDFSKNMYTLIDVVAVVPLPFRIVTGFSLPAVTDFPFAHYLLVCVVPMLRLLKLIRRFGQIQLLAHVFRTTGDALKFLLFLVSIIVLLFSTMLYIIEPETNVDSMFTAMWVSTVTVTTVGFGDITPVTGEGKVLMGVLCFFSSLFMAMPISVLGNAMSHAWTDRNRILLMARTRQRLKRHGFNAGDLPRLFRQYDGNETGDLSMDEFCDMIVKMKVGMGPREAEELFELFDVDGSGGIDDKEFMKALFPDDYRRIFLRSESMRKTTSVAVGEKYCKAVTYDSEMAGSVEATPSSFMALGKVALAAQTAAKEAGLGDGAPAEDCHS